MPNRSSTIINKYISNVVKGAAVPTDVAEDGDFANWEMLNYPDSWTMNDIILDATAVEGWSRSEDQHAGTYAINLECVKNPGDGSRISPAISGFYDTDVANKTMQARFYSKRNVGTANIFVAAFYYNGADDYEWNLTTSSWIVKGSGDNNIYEQITIDGTYTQYTSTQRTIPADGTEFWFNTLAGSATPNDSALVDNNEWLLAGADVATNGTFEAWTEFANYTDPLTDYTAVVPEDWEFGTDGDTGYSYMARSASQQAGTYALSMLLGDDASVQNNADRGYVYQTYAGTADAVMTASVYTKSTNSKTGYLIFLDAAPGSHTKIWDFVANTWDVLATTVTELPGTSNALTCSGTGSYVINSEAATIPTSGNFVAVLMSDKGDGATQQTYFFDTLVMTTNVSAGAEVLFDLENPSDASNLDSGDYILKAHTTGGTPDVGFGIKAGGGEGEVLDDELDFSNIAVDFADPTSAQEPVTSNYLEASTTIPALAMSWLGSVSVDYKTVAQYTLYTVPTGYKLYGMYVQVETTVTDAPNNDSGSSIGTSGGSWTDVMSTAPQPSGAVGTVTQSAFSQTTAVAAGGVVKVDISGADTGTDLDAIVTLYGILIAV